jgi:predicted  nucleic acid-binding Zn-ribbon protein
MNETFSLYRLQQLDSNRLQILKRVKQIDQIVASDKAVIRAKAILQKTVDAVEESEKNLKDLHDKADEKIIKQKLTQNKLFGGKISASKELQDLQAENEALTRAIKNLEEEQMLVLETHDERLATKEKAENALKSLLNKKASENSLLLGERLQLINKLPGINSQREALKAQLNDTLLEEYSNLFKNKGGIAVSEIIEDGCKSCGVELSPNEVQAAGNPNVILRCKSCGRILYKL